MVKEGVKTAVELLLEARPDVAARQAEQLALLPTPAALADRAADDEAARRSGPGRPPGSRNKRTEEWVEFIQARYRDPLIFLAETWSRPVDVLAAELGCPKDEAFKIQRAAAEAALPYLHQKLPQAVSIDAKSDLTLQLVMPSADGYVARQAGVQIIEATIVENQEVKADGEA